MKLFSEKVSETFTNSSHNILKVESFNEIFFDVFEIEINKSKYPVEKISTYNGNPVVSVPVLVEGTEVFYPFVLTKGKFEVFFNEANTMEFSFPSGNFDVIKEAYVAPEEEVIEEVEESVETLEVELVELVDKKQEILEQIQKAKQQAKESVDQYKRKTLKESADKVRKNNKLLIQTLDSARDSLVSEFVDISSKIKFELFDVYSEQYSELKETLDNKIQTISDELNESLHFNFEKSSEEFDAKLKTLVKELYTSSVIPRVEKELGTIAEDIYKKVELIETSLDSKLESKAENSLVEGVNRELDAIRNANIELNNNINRGVNKALSRAGNVKTMVDKLTEDVNEKLQLTEDNIALFYNEKIQLLKEEYFDIADEARNYYINLISENREALLGEIEKIKNEKPVEYVIEANGKQDKKDFKSIEKDWDKKIKDLFENYKVDLRKYVTVYASGGGTNATQYQDGGTMNGNLVVVGSISASQYLGIPTSGGITGDYLPLSGGEVDGNLVVVGSISASQYLGITPSMVGLGNVDNTSDTNKPVSTAQQMALNLKANLSGGNTFSGVQTFGASNFYIDSNTFFVDASLDRVGIGTISPGYKLDVNGTLNASGNATIGVASIDATTGKGIFPYGSPLGALDIGGDVNAATRSSNVRKLASIVAPEYTNGRKIEFFNLDSTGSTVAALSIGGRVGGSQYCATSLSFVTAANTSTTGGTSRLFIDSSGNVGVGTASPTVTLQLGTVTNTATHPMMLFGSYDSNAGYPQLAFNNPSTYYMAIGVSTAGNLVFGRTQNLTTWNSEQFVLKQSNGNVGIGVSDPAYKLDVNGTFNVAGNATLLGTLTTTGKHTANGQGALSALAANDVMTKGLVEQFLMDNDVVYVVDDFHGGASVSTGVVSPQGELPWLVTTLQGTTVLRYGANAALSIPCPGGAAIQTGANNRDGGALSMQVTYAGGGSQTVSDYNSTSIMKWRFYVQSDMGLRIGMGGGPAAPTFQSSRFIGLAAHPAASAWTAATVIAAGDYRRPTVANGLRYYASVGGTTHATTEPTWPTGAASTVTDGTVTWTEDGRDGSANFQYIIRDGTALTGTQTDSGVAFAAGWHVFTLRYLGSNSWGMSIDGAAEATLTLAIPSTISWIMWAQSYTASQKYLMFDYFKYFQRGR